MDKKKSIEALQFLTTELSNGAFVHLHRASISSLSASRSSVRNTPVTIRRRCSGWRSSWPASSISVAT